jgi:hypothetical protein
VRASASEIKTLENRLELTGHNIENYETQIGSLRSSINNSTATIYDKDSKIRFLVITFFKILTEYFFFTKV